MEATPERKTQPRRKCHPESGSKGKGPSKNNGGGGTMIGWEDLEDDLSTAIKDT